MLNLYTNLLISEKAEHSEERSCFTDTKMEHNDLKEYLMQQPPNSKSIV